MFGKKFFTLAIGYVAGSIVTSLFTDKKGAMFKKELEKAKAEGKDTKKMVLDNFIETQKHFLETLKKEVLTEDNVAYLKGKRKELESLVNDYKAEGLKLLDELKENGEGYLDTAKDKLEELYKEKKVELSKLKGEAPEKIDELKNTLLSAFEDLKKSLKKPTKTTTKKTTKK